MLRKPRLIVYVLALTVLGCTTTYGRKFDVTAVPAIKIGVSKKTDVENALGSPYNTNTDADGNEIWHWDYRELTDARLLTAYGLVGSKSSTAAVDVTFHDGVVTKCLYSTSAHQGPGYDGMQGGGAGSKSTAKCSDLSQKAAAAN